MDAEVARYDPLLEEVLASWDRSTSAPSSTDAPRCGLGAGAPERGRGGAATGNAATGRSLPVRRQPRLLPERRCGALVREGGAPGSAGTCTGAVRVLVVGGGRAAGGGARWGGTGPGALLRGRRRGDRAAAGRRRHSDQDPGGVRARRPGRQHADRRRGARRRGRRAPAPRRGRRGLCPPVAPSSWRSPELRRGLASGRFAWFATSTPSTQPSRPSPRGRLELAEELEQATRRSVPAEALENPLARRRLRRRGPPHDRADDLDRLVLVRLPPTRVPKEDVVVVCRRQVAGHLLGRNEVGRVVIEVSRGRALCQGATSSSPEAAASTIVRSSASPKERLM